MRQVLRKHLLLFLSCLFILLACSLWYSLIHKGGSSYELAYVNLVSKKLSKELDLVKKESESVSDKIASSEWLNFSKLLSSSKYPYFVFRNHYLFFWSDNKISPKAELLRGSAEVRLVNLRSGKFLVHRNALYKKGDLYEIFFFIPITREYSIENKYLRTGQNEEIFGSTPISIHNQPSVNSASIFNVDGDYLFSLNIPKDPHKRYYEIYWYVFIASTIGLILFIAYIILQSRRLTKVIGYDRAIFLCFCSLILLRIVLWVVNYPYVFIEFDLFDPKYFASSDLSSSLGDFLLNLIFFLVASVFLLKNYSRTKLVKKLLRLDRPQKVLWASILIIFNFLFFYHVFDLIKVLYAHSQWSLGITQSISFNSFKFISLLVFSLLFSLLLIYSYIFIRICINLVDQKKYGFNQMLLTTFFFSGCFIYIFSDLHWFVYLLGCVFLWSVMYFKLPLIVDGKRFNAYLFILITSLSCSLMGAYVIYFLDLRTDIVNKQKFADHLLVENDILGEYLLNEASLYIRNDPFIQSRMLSPFSNKDVIEQKIKKVYLGEYFDKYDIKVYVFDALGRFFDQSYDVNSWNEISESYKVDNFKTSYDNIFLINDFGKRGIKRYLAFNSVKRNNMLIGHVLIELRQKKIVPNSVYPELLVDKKFLQPWENKNYNYAYYSDKEVILSYGQFNYESFFISDFFDVNPSIFEEGIRMNGFHHLAVESQDGKVVLISSESSILNDFFSNFSYLFVVLMVFTLFILILYSINFRFKNLNVNFSTKIQIYLNLAFFLPLLIVSLTTLSIISNAHKEDLNKSFIKKAESVSSTINNYLENARGDDRGNVNLENILIEKSRFIETDINLFDNKGRLSFSNQPLLYENGLMSKLINPIAFSKVHDHSNNVFMLSECVGDLKYNSVYIPIKAYGSGNVLGILSIPFFESKQEIEKQLIEVLTTILNIFVSIFLIFLVLSFLVSRLLTVPLDLITQKLKRTNLSTQNEPLEWNSNDEIGLLVGEYNRMLLKLEESKAALSKSEKESAWREMAQQVAHEIKNPLTPMKLSIQHLQRALKDKADNIHELTDKSLNVLLEQVNTLNEIATSFSVFAKMPIPRSEKFEISGVLERICRLHSADTKVDIRKLIEPGHFFVMGDEQLMGNIFTNLILNAVQSVSSDLRPLIEITLKRCDGDVMISFKDNGTGIPENIRDKVFVPNFSTKYSGSGLGLAIAKRGVEHAGGKIWFETMESYGTTFYIELPLIHT